LPSLSSADVILFGILIASLSFHEAAHAWTANRLGDPTARLLGRLTLNPIKHIDLIGTIVFPLVALTYNIPLIGWAKPVPVDMRNLRSPRRDFAVVALAGPLSNMILAVGMAAIVSVAVTESSGGLLGDILVRSVVTNVLLAVFNLIPVPPLDGGNVLAGLVPESFAQALDGLRQWGFILLYVLMFAGVLGNIVVPIARVILRWLGIYV
jgi:Zn-dependent protease